MKSPVGRGPKPTWIKAAAGSLAVAVALLSVFSADAHKRITTSVTWDKDIRPLFEAKCMPCHHPGGVAPSYVDLTTYGKGPNKAGGAWAWAAAIEEEVMTGRMPPWRPDPRFGNFSNDRRLTPDERNLIVAWIQGAAPEGKQRGLPTPEGLDKANWSLGTPAMEVKMPEEFVLAPGKRDGAYSFTFDLPKDFGTDEKGEPIRDKWITAVEFLPGAPQAVHTIIAFAHDPHDAPQDFEKVEIQKPYDPLAPESKNEAEETRMRPMRMGAHFLGQWTRGDSPIFYPTEAARKLRAGSTIEVQVLYHKFGVEDLNAEFRDRSSLGLHFANSMTEFMVDSLPLQPEPFTIPADDAAFRVTATATLDEASHLLGISPLLGPLAKSLEVTAAYPDGKRQILLSVPEADFKWSASYHFAAPLAVPAGTRIELEGRLDNSAANKNNPNKPPKAIPPRQERFSAWLDFYPDEHRFIPVPTLTPPPITQGENSGMLFGIPPGAEESAAARPSPTPLAEATPAPAPPAEHAAMDDSTMKPQHAGIVFPFGNEFHSVEIALPFPDEFRVYLYDEASKPIDPRNFSGKITVETETKQNLGFALEHREFGQDYLMARVPEVKTFPVHFEIKVNIAGQTQDFQGKLDAISRDPVAETMLMMEHMDHEPVHGGLFIMAEDLYHHLEGALTANDEFRLYYYGERKKPLSPRNFRARLVMETFDDATEEIKEKEFQLRMIGPDDMFAVAKIPPVKEFPVDFNVKVWMADKEYTFSFAFDKLTQLKEAPPADAASAGGVPTPVGTFIAHEHTRAPLVIPAKPEEMAREIYKRDLQIRAIIDSKRLLDLYGPPMDAKELSDALKRAGVKTLESSKKRAVVQACDKIGQGAVFIHEQGHQQNQALVEKQAYRLFAEGLAELKKLYPE